MKKRKDGRYVQAVTVNGKRKYFYGDTQREVKRQIAEYRLNADAPLYTYKYMAEEWRTSHMDKLSLGTQRAYTAPFLRLAEHFGKKYMSDISYKDVQGFFSSLGMSYKSATIHKTILSQIFDYAIVEKELDISNPCDRIKLDNRLPRSYRSSATPEQEEAILNTSADEFLLAPIIYYTGLRCGEALALQFKDIDYVNGVINVSKAVNHRGNQPVISPPKTPNAVRQVPLLPQLANLIGKGNPNDYIVSGEKPLTKSALAKRWAKWEKEHGVKIDRHSIRHTYATKLYNAGVDIKSTQKILGHANVTTTLNVYTHLNSDYLDEVKNKLSDNSFDNTFSTK